MTSIFLTITEYCMIVGKIGFLSNAIFGGVLVLLTLFCIKRQFGSYKKLLVNFQVVGFIFALIEFLFPVILHTYNRSLAYFSHSPVFHLTKCSLELLIGISTGVFAATLCLLAIQFLYRYWAVFDTSKLVYFEGWYYLIWIVYMFVFGFFWAYSVSYCFSLDDAGKQYLADEIYSKYQENVSEIPILSLMSYEVSNGKVFMEFC
ncbi:hypothetical protein GCK72_019778 [Caenorhabditis remanei]|uniref:Uncharacterized protein n=1 Tax=Caenorhabditis remanei TaxID=31234 RepID=A0A6A5GFG1_CAERE|nr:hypothetical protein GCK72_019778 [Caenorhabditis remanei]KAF1753222.1 hypothetical protein GCK72_019778 [Caenorhabditis remanei]